MNTWRDSRAPNWFRNWVRKARVSFALRPLGYWKLNDWSVLGADNMNMDFVYVGSSTMAMLQIVG